MKIKDLRRVEDGLKKSFASVREELDQHLDSINGNTSELQEVYSYLSNLDKKMTKLTERLDELQLGLQPKGFKIEAELSLREQEVFLVLYTASEAVSVPELAKKLGLTEDMASSYVFKLLGKGVPVKKMVKDGVFYFSLDELFKDLQARKNILQINETVSKQLLEEDAL